MFWCDILSRTILTAVWILMSNLVVCVLLWFWLSTVGSIFFFCLVIQFWHIKICSLEILLWCVFLPSFSLLTAFWINCAFTDILHINLANMKTFSTCHFKSLRVFLSLGTVLQRLLHHGGETHLGNLFFSVGFENIRSFNLIRLKYLPWSLDVCLHNFYL